MDVGRPILVGICGGSASGKTSLARRTREGLGRDAVIVCQDWYYRDRRGLSVRECEKLNFDHPRAIEHPLMLRQLRELRAGRSVRAPMYDYATHARSRETHDVRPAPVIIVDGIFVLCDERIRRLLDVSVFIDVPAEERLLRRVRRDVVERRVDLAETLRIWESFVRPMHGKFIGPSARSATWRWRQLEDRRFPARLLRELRARLRQRRRRPPSAVRS